MNALQYIPIQRFEWFIFMVRQLQEKFLEKRKDLFFAFVDLEKAFDRVPREVVRWALRQFGMEE